MKKLSLYLIALALSSCASQNSFMSLYDKKYQFKVYDETTHQIYYTNSIDSSNPCLICFISHNLDRICCTNATLIQLK